MRLLVFAVGLSLVLMTFTGQADPASTILLNGTSSSTPADGVESGRYQVKESSESLPDPAARKAKATRPKTRKLSSEPPAPIVVHEKEEIAPPPLVTPSYAEQVKDLVLGHDQPSIEAYKDQVHPDDIRLNKIEINVSPGLLYYDSKSSYSYRNYQSYSPFVYVGAEIWWTPFIGLYGKYGTSVGADIVDNGAAHSRTSVTHELIDGGVDLRTYFGLSRRSNSITFGLHYFEYKFALPGDNQFRSQTKSSGVGIHFQARFPVAPSYSWILGARMDPRVSHGEFGTSLGLQSGSSPVSSRLGLFVGGEFKLSRQHQLIWSLSSELEKNQFSGSSNLADPETGTAPQGVSVGQTMSLLTLGYRWGH